MTVYVDLDAPAAELRQKIYDGNLIVLTRLQAVADFVGHTRQQLTGLSEKIVCEIIRGAGLRAESTHYDVPKPRTEQELTVLPAPGAVLLFSGAQLRRRRARRNRWSGPQATAARWRHVACPLEVSPRTAPRSYA